MAVGTLWRGKSHQQGGRLHALLGGVDEVFLNQKFQVTVGSVIRSSPSLAEKRHMAFMALERDKTLLVVQPSRDKHRAKPHAFLFVSV
jgi:hypothetical protein